MGVDWLLSGESERERDRERKRERNALASVIRLRRISGQALANFVARAWIIRYEKSRKLIIMELRSCPVRLSRN